MNEQEVKDIVRREVNNGCGNLGYREIWHLLQLEYHLHVPRHLFARIAKEVQEETKINEKAVFQLWPKLLLGCQC